MRLSFLSRSLVRMAFDGITKAIQFYRRELPESCVSFTSEEGKQIFKEALGQGHMNGYFKLAAQFQTQDEPSYCGLSTLVMVLNTLGVDPGRVWKGPWRWYHESMLDCCAPLDVVKVKGITFKQFLCLAKCTGLDVRSFPADKSSLEHFRELVRSVTTTEDKVAVICYSRKTLQQTGDGHFAPIGGYHLNKDLVLVMDVARFKYPPHWAPLTTIWQAMNTPDAETGDPRGYCLLTASSDVTKPLLFFKLSPSFVNVQETPPPAVQDFVHHWSKWLSSTANTDSITVLLTEALAVLRSGLAGFPAENALFTEQVETCGCRSEDLMCVIDELLNAVCQSDLYLPISQLLSHDSQPFLKLWKPENGSCCGHPNFVVDAATMVTIFLYSWPYPTGDPLSVGSVLSRHLQTGFTRQKVVLRNELSQLQKQLSVVLDQCFVHTK